jgi:hypothetical protein
MHVLAMEKVKKCLFAYLIHRGYGFCFAIRLVYMLYFFSDDFSEGIIYRNL